MDNAKYKIKSEHLEKLLEERLVEIAREKGRHEGRLLAVRRVLISLANAKIGEIDPGLRSRVEEETDVERLEDVVVAVASAPDPATVEEILGKL